MLKIIDQVVNHSGKPLYLENPEHWGVPATWIEAYLQETNPDIDLQGAYKEFFIWLFFGLTNSDYSHIFLFLIDYPSIDKAKFQKDLWNYCNTALTTAPDKKLINSIMDTVLDEKLEHVYFERNPLV